MEKDDKIKFGKHILSILSVISLTALVGIPLLETIGRRVTGIGITGAASWCQHLTLWISLIGALLATSSDKHIVIATKMIFNLKHGNNMLTSLTGIITAVILFLLVLSSAQLVYYQADSPEVIGGWFPIWLAQLTMPAAFLVMAGMTIVRSNQHWRIRLFIALSAIGIAVGFLFVPEQVRGGLITPMVIMLMLFGFAGMPLYAVLGGVSLVLLHSASIPLAALPAEAYRTFTNPVLPSIPLFALAGSILAAGGAPQRLVHMVRAWTGWMPGGIAISTVCVSALFTAVTGASGVTILALGGMLLPVLIASQYHQRFSIGLLTASGSVGLLFPPSLPVILYGVYGHVPIDKMFMGALLVVMGVAAGLVSYLVDEQIPMKAIDLVQSAIHSKWIFLIILNLVLLLIGALMDIYTAIVVIVPLIGPLGLAYGIDPVHLGIIFLANLELGYLTPPVGMNLFFSSLRFKKPLLEIWKTVTPFLLVFAFWVLLITYVPFITVGAVAFLSR